MWRKAPTPYRDTPLSALSTTHTLLLQAIFEYLLILAGSKQGVDPSSPYDSLAEALLDSIGRKVGSVLEERGWQQQQQDPSLGSASRRRAQGTDVPAVASACWV